MSEIDFESMTKEELLALAKKNNITVHPRILKGDLVALLNLHLYPRKKEKSGRDSGKATVGKQAAASKKESPEKSSVTARKPDKRPADEKKPVSAKAKSEIKAGSKAKPGLQPKVPEESKPKTTVEPKTGPVKSARKPSRVSAPEPAKPGLGATPPPRQRAAPGKRPGAMPPRACAEAEPSAAQRRPASVTLDSTGSTRMASKRHRGQSEPGPSAPGRSPAAETHEFLPKMLAEDAAQEAKFMIGRPEIRDEMRGEAMEELPHGYEDNRLALMVRDPYWLYTYWDIHRGKIEEGARALNRGLHELRWILRLHPAMSVGAAANFPPIDFEVDPNARSWYVHVNSPGSSYYAEIGLMDPDGKFYRLALSNTVTLPIDRPSDIIDERWMTAEEEFQKLYAMSGGFRIGAGSEQFQRGQRLPFGLFSGAVSSFWSAAVPAKRERKFWFWLDAELIVHGGTEPDAKVTLGGQRIQLRPDGTFTARFALPDGIQTIPVTAESYDGIESRTITPEVTRQTERPEPVIKEN
ncbi:MAG: DUF4912 domain-containing protein [Nitrospinae bacterium]|nr:DUF4912 domain-containing protein [Nitrospinota bacterium]